MARVATHVPTALKNNCTLPRSPVCLVPDSCMMIVSLSRLFVGVLRVEKADATIKTFYTNLTPRFGKCCCTP